MRIGFASEASIVSPKNLSHAYDSSTFQEMEGDLKAHAIADQTSSTKHCPQPCGPRFQEARPTQRPRSHTAPKVKGETKEGREYGLGIAHGKWRNSEEPTSHVARDVMHIISPNGKRSNKTWTTYTSRTLHTDHSTNMVEEPKIDIGRILMCSVISQVQ